MIPTFSLGGLGRSGAAGAIAPTDPSFASVVSLLHFDGANGSTVFTDQKGNTWTGAGSPVISTASSQFGGASIRFNGSSRITTPDSAGFNFSANQLCNECWINPDGVSGVQAIFGQWQISTFCWLLYLNNAIPTLAVSANGSSVTGTLTATSTISAGVFTHLAIDRDSGGTFRMFVGGILQPTTISAPSLVNSGSPISIGAQADGATPFTGYIDESRMTNGNSRHTTSFTPSGPFPDS